MQKLTTLLLYITISLTPFCQVNITQGLVAYYPFNGNANDASGNGNNGILRNGVIFGPDRDSNPNSAVYFDGINDFIEVLNSGSLSPRRGFSFVLRFKTSNLSAVQTLLARRKMSDQRQAQFQTFINWNVHPGFGYAHNYTNNTDCNNIIIQYNRYVNTGNNTIIQNQWHCVIGTFDGNLQKIYLDGVLMESLATPLPLMDSCENVPMTMGKYTDFEPQFFSGAMDEVRIYNRALTNDEVVVLCQNVTVVPDFTIPDTVCVNEPVNIINTTTGATTHYWNFCVGNINQAPIGTNLGAFAGSLGVPVFMDYVFENGNYYGFLTSYSPGYLVRLNFGNSLLNTPTVTNLGNFGGAIPLYAEGIQVVKNEGKWYAILVGGFSPASNPAVIKVDFGTNITNPTPIATNWGNIGNLLQPIDLHVFQEAGNWYGFTVNAENNTITRFNFTNSFDNTPTAVNLGNVGNLAYPTGIYAIKDGANWRVFITNAGSNARTSATFSLSRLDFGTSLLNTPTGVNLGNPGGLLRHPRDLTIMRFCGQVVGFAVNGFLNSPDMIKMDFNNDLTSVPTITSLGNNGNLGFPHSLSKIFRVGADLYTFITNADNGTITRLQFAGCNNSSIPDFTGANPPPITYSVPGTYNINLTIDDGLPTQASICKQVVVIQNISADFAYTQDVCNPLSVQFSPLGTLWSNPLWLFGDGNSSTSPAPAHTYSATGNYTVKYVLSNGICTDTIRKTISVNIINEDIVLTPDTVLCLGSTKKLRTMPALNFCWTPSTYLNDATLREPTTSTPQSITYYYTAQVTGTNIITNGNFNGGNTGFISSYNYATPNTTEGEYFVGTNPQAWNGSLSNCTDHTTGNGNMMLVNGSPVPNVVVWKQTVTVTPNTNYAFSTWVQALWPPNPAQLRFSINGRSLGNTITASLPTCTWTQFYTTWNSGNNTTADISIVNVNTQIQGNDFALDDISFAPVFIKKDSVKITVDSPYVRANNDTTICEGRNVQLNTVGAQNYSWSPATGLSGSNIANPTATPANTTQYIVTGVNANGCTAKDTVNISVNPKPAVTTSNDTSICRNTSVQLFANGGNTYSWTPSATLNNASVANPVASPASNTIYYVSVTDNNNCSNNDSIKVDIIPAAQFSASSAQTICINESIQLNASGGDIYSWSPAISLTNASIANPVASPQVSTNYTVTITETTCNESTNLVVPVNVNSLPKINVTKSNDIDCSKNTSQLNASGAVQYSWAPATTLNNALSANPIASPVANTQYNVTGTDANGCSDTSSVMVYVDFSGTALYLMSNAFTPNNDGLNDCFGIKYWGVILELEFSIFNRWGERVFYTTNPASCWNGKFRGIEQKTDVYVYLIKAKTACDPSVLRKGVVTLIR